MTATARWIPLALALAQCGPPTPPPSPRADLTPAATAPEQADTARSAEEQAAAEPAGGVRRELGSTPANAPTVVAAVEAPQACPEGMSLVDGDYCSEVKQTCEKSWYDKANRKVICERFAEPSECAGQKSHKRFCIDRHEWPNRPGQRPEVMNTFYQAQVKCAAMGKRMCTESEWTFACEGPEMSPYPYGYARDANVCNGDRAWDDPNMPKVAKRDAGELARLWQGVPSGSQPGCVSAFGVYDLPGNVDEVAASENDTPTWRGKYDSVTTGGPWYRGVRNQCRPKIYTHSEGFYYYYLGFRCCSEPDGKPTDPRTPKQLARGMSFGEVERLARFDTGAMREKLKLIAEGKCECAERDVLCKTMCGTLLGASAKDAELRK
jgi:hypothetical protein